MQKVAVQTSPPADELPIGRRVRLKAQVRYGVGDDLAIGYAVDLSISGLGLIGSQRFAPGTRVRVLLHLHTHPEEVLELIAIVRYSSRLRIGLAFVDVSVELERKLLDCITTAENISRK